MAGLPVPRSQLSSAGAPADQLAPPRPPAEVQAVLERLWRTGHGAYLVGGGVRDWLLGRRETDWDVATDARPERLLELFPSARYENRFGTVTIGGVEATTFRRDHVYADHRRPDSVTFSDSIDEDLARRDFTVNAIAWGRSRGAKADGTRQPQWIDPTGGLADLDARLLRAVGDPDRRFDEDALRLVRAARLAGQLGFAIEAETRAAMARAAHLVAHVSNERIGGEFRRMVRADPPSAALRALADTGLLEPLFPELAAQRGIAQSKVAAGDLWQHTLRTLDASATLAGTSERLRFAALLHDVGKPATFADGRFHGHDVAGARIADGLLGRLAFGRREIEPIVSLVRLHMFQYQRSWSDAAVRRFIRRAGAELVADLLRLRQADNMGSGLAADAGDLDELRRRVHSELTSGAPLSLRDLAVDGRVLTAELGVAPGPIIGRLLEHLLDWVMGDPARNTREQLLAEARAALTR